MPAQLNIDLMILSKTINTIGLLCDIVGALLVSTEVTRQFNGKQFIYYEDDNEPFYGNSPPRESEEYTKWTAAKYSTMKRGLFFLVIGFVCQIISCWTPWPSSQKVESPQQSVVQEK